MAREAGSNGQGYNPRWIWCCFVQRLPTAAGAEKRVQQSVENARAPIRQDPPGERTRSRASRAAADLQNAARWCTFAVGQNEVAIAPKAGG